MKRTNSFEIVPQTDADKACLRRLLDASASLWNEVTYARRQRFADDRDGTVWDADTGALEGRYKGVVGSATAQQMIGKNSEAWRSFFSLNEKYHDPDDDSVTEKPSPPGYWGNDDEGRELRTYIRKDQYTLEWGERSRLEIPVGQQLKDKFGLGCRERLRLEVAGNPPWDGEQGRLELYYDETDDTFRAFQPVTVPDSRQDSPLASHEAALDVGANNLVACTTTTGQQYLYDGRDLFKQFRETTEHIAHRQATVKREEGQDTSKQIRRLYRKRTRRRDHAQNALVRNLVERLHEDGIATVYVGDLTDVLETHWSWEVNEKTHQFWAFRAFIDRLACVCEEYGIRLKAESEAWTSQECPECGSTNRTTRHQDMLTCPCGFEGHADLTASETFLQKNSDTAVRPMARPVRLKWDDHDWSGISHPHESPNEERTNRSTGDGKVATVESA